MKLSKVAISTGLVASFMFIGAESLMRIHLNQLMKLLLKLLTEITVMETLVSLTLKQKVLM